MKTREGVLQLATISSDLNLHVLNYHRQVFITRIRYVFNFIFVAIITFLFGCSNPYALRIDSVNYSRISDEHANAAIQMSPPSIYARETLINDRRREQEYLERVLEESKTKTFESELRRELTNISALSASLGLSFDEGAKEEFLKQRTLSDSETSLTLERLSAASQQLELQQTYESDRLASVSEQNQLINQRNALLQQGQIDQAKLQQQLAVENLRLELIRQQYEVERLQSIVDNNREKASLAALANQGEQSNQEYQSTALAPLPESSEVTPVTPGTALDSGLSLLSNPTLFSNRDLSTITLNSADTQSLISSLDSKLTHALNMLKAEIKKAQGVDVSLSPEQEFAARQAYRRTIRSAIAENNLDDLHDKGGNSLFRLQFTATVFPGKDVDRWGLASYRLSPPDATKDRLGSLYNDWLTHVTQRLNEAADSRDDYERPLGLSDIRYELLQSTGLYDIARFYQDKDTQIKPISDCFVADSMEVANSHNCISIPIAVPPKSAVEFTSAKLYWDHILLNVLYIKLVDAISRGETRALGEYSTASYKAKRKLSDFYKVTSLEEAIGQLRNLAQASDAISNNDFNDLIAKLSVNAKSYRETNSFKDEIGVSKNRAEIVQRAFDELYGAQTKNTSSGQAPKPNQTPATSPNEVHLIEALSKLTLKELGEILPAKEVLKRVRVYRQLGPTVVKSAEGVIGRVKLNSGQRDTIMQIIERLSRNVAISHQAIPILNELSSREGFTPETQLPELLVGTDALPLITWEQLQPGSGVSICPPDTFANAVLNDGSSFSSSELDSCGLFGGEKFGGEARPYATTPRIRSQRISTVASAVDAFELGLSLARRAPSVGISGDAGIGLARTASGKVQAREQAPMVVGFAAASTVSINEMNNASFGWVFGPRAVIDSEDKALKLKHQVATHDVTADISMPGWWPYAQAELKTSWIGDEWKKGGLESADAREQDIKIKLAQTRADLDGLTDYIGQKIYGTSLQGTHIASVSPKSISLCRDSAHLVLHGSNLWRGTKVFLDGIKANTGSIEVLPDMEGIEAQFDTTKLRKRSHDASTVSLKVWTRDGFADYSVKVTGKDNNGSCQETAKSTPPKFQLVSIVPDKVSSCLGKKEMMDFVVTLRGIELRDIDTSDTDIDVLLGGVSSKIIKIHNYGEEDNKIEIIKVTLDSDINKLPYWKSHGSIPLVVLGEKNTIQYDIPILSVTSAMCGKPPPVVSGFDTAATSVHSVSGNDIIDVCVNKLMLGLSNSKGGLEKVKQIEWLGQKVTPAPGVNGKSLYAVFENLPKLEKRGSDKLPLRLFDASKKALGTLQVTTACERPGGEQTASVKK